MNNGRKSSYSYANGNCVEVADGDGCVLVRDTKNPGGLVLAFPAGAWWAFGRRVIVHGGIGRKREADGRI